MSLGIADVCLPYSEMQTVHFTAHLGNFQAMEKFKAHTQNWVGPEVQTPCMDVNNKKLRVEVLTGLPQQLQDLATYILESPSITQALQSAWNLTLSDDEVILIKPVITEDAHNKMGHTKLIKQINTIKGYVLTLIQFQETPPKAETLQFYIRNLESIVSILNRKQKKSQDDEVNAERTLDLLEQNTSLSDDEKIVEAMKLSSLILLNSNWSSIYSTSENLFSAALGCAKGTQTANN